MPVGFQMCSVARDETRVAASERCGFEPTVVFNVFSTHSITLLHALSSVASAPEGNPRKEADISDAVCESLKHGESCGARGYADARDWSGGSAL